VRFLPCCNERTSHRRFARNTGVAIVDAPTAQPGCCMRTPPQKAMRPHPCPVCIAIGVLIDSRYPSTDCCRSRRHLRGKSYQTRASSCRGAGRRGHFGRRRKRVARFEYAPRRIRIHGRARPERKEQVAFMVRAVLGSNRNTECRRRRRAGNARLLSSAQARSAHVVFREECKYEWRGESVSQWPQMLSRQNASASQELSTRSPDHGLAGRVRA